MTETVESLIAYCSQDGRVCPQPVFWNELWEMLGSPQDLFANTRGVYHPKTANCLEAAESTCES